MLKLASNSSRVKTARQVCALIASAVPGDEIRIYSELDRAKWESVLPQVAVQIVSDAEVNVLSEKLPSWYSSFSGTLLQGAHQVHPVIVWTGTREELCEGVRGKAANISKGNGVVALIMFASSKRISDADTMMSAMEAGIFPLLHEDFLGYYKHK